MVLVLTLLMVVVDAQAQIAFMSREEWMGTMGNLRDGRRWRVISKTSLTISILIGIPHGPPTVNGLPFVV